ncbi:MAG: hypothetical protein ACOC47_00990 [Alkalispirochaetaceae bacterium]
MVGRFPRLLATGAAALALAGCDILSTTPFPDFLDYTDESVDLSGEIGDISNDPADTAYSLDVVYTATDEPRVMLLVEPPADPDAGFDYRGELLLFDAELDLVGSARPGSDLDTFGRPFAYAHDGNLLVSNSIIATDGSYIDSVTYEGYEGPAFVDPNVTGDPHSPRTYVFSRPAGDFAGFELVWQAYAADATPGAPYTLPVSEPRPVPIIPASEQPNPDTDGYDDLGYQLLDAVYNVATDEVTFLLSEPSEERVLAARALLDDIEDGALTSLVSGPNDFPVEVDADRPLDVHADRRGFFLRRRDGWLERQEWTSEGELDTRGGSQRIVGDRYFDRKYGFLSGPDAATGYMYRFDPSSRVLTRYRRWW